MTAPTLTADAVPRRREAARRYRVERSADWPSAIAAWEGEGGAGTAFQDPRWLEAWYAAHRGRTGAEPVIVTARDGDGRPALLLPLVRRRVGGVRLAEFADLGLTDYNLPLLGPAAPREAAGSARLWRALRRAVPADLLRLRKMPALVDHAPNPLALVPGAGPCALNGNVVELGDEFEDFMRGTLARPVRMEFERSWRVFGRHAGARLRRLTDPEEAVALLDVMDGQQRRRQEAMGGGYDLDRPEAAALYRRLARLHLADGYAVMTALTAGEEVVAALFALRTGRTLTVTRLSNAGGRDWSNCSPGRLLLQRSMALMHAEGCRRFDFTIGNYDYKRRFGVEPVPLVDLAAALTPLGLPGLARARAAAFLRRQPRLDARVRGWLRRPAPAAGG